MADSTYEPKPVTLEGFLADRERMWNGFTSGTVFAVMNGLTRPIMTPAQFLDWEDRQELRYEFDGVRAIAINGGALAHATIQTNLTTALQTRLRGTACRAFGRGLKIEVAGRIRYPDAFVISTHGSPKAKVISEPVVIFEILSESTARQDLVIKNAEYRATPSLQRYIILHQASAAAEIFVRRGEAWVSELASSIEDVLPLPEIGIEIPMTELYADVELDTEAEDEVP